MALKDLVLPSWEDPEVQIVYELICNVGEPPRDDHWEGWVARHIVGELRRRRKPAPGSYAAMFPEDVDEIMAEQEAGAGAGAAQQAKATGCA